MLLIEKLDVFIIKPSKYDDDGYVVRYVKGVLPSNTLACMKSLTDRFSAKWKTEKNIDIKVEVIDDIVSAIPYKKIAARNIKNRMAVAALVGVQTNQFVRASEIARKLNALGVQVFIGGFHVSGILALFEQPSSEIQELMDLGITVVEGEAEDVWENMLSDAVEGKRKTFYKAASYPDISDAPIPDMDRKYLKKFALPNMATIDCSRGCPFNCSFCTIINVQGHKMRCRSAENVLNAIRFNLNKGVDDYFFTDDNFSRNPAWEAIFDGLIEMNEIQGHKVSFMMQVDTICHKIPGFVVKASRAGCTQVFIGMESINQENLDSVGKKQNKVSDYANYIETWHNVGVMTHVGYIIGFPFDTLESVREDIKKLKIDLKVDQASFFILTPLPGSKDHFDMVNNAVYMDSDLNNFDSFHIVMNHPRMTRDEWISAYNEAWDYFYSLENLKTTLIRAGEKSYWSIFKNITWYKNSMLEPRHPMISGFIRLKDRNDTRPGTPEKSFFSFYGQRIRELYGGFWKRVNLFFELQELWLLTRKPEDPKFKFVADFTATLNETKHKLSSIALKDTHDKPVEEIKTTLSGLKEKIEISRNETSLKGRARKKFDTLVEELNAAIEKFNLAEQYSRGIATLNSHLTNSIKIIEESTLKNVRKRRKITDFWKLTSQRIQRGKLFRFILSTPKIVISGVRDFFMSIVFAIHMKKKGF